MPQPDAPDDLRIEIGAREIYDTLVDTANAVKRLDEKFDDRVETLDDRIADVASDLADLGDDLTGVSDRVSSLEKWRYAAGGAIALGGTAVGWLIGLRGGA